MKSTRQKLTKSFSENKNIAEKPRSLFLLKYVQPPHSQNQNEKKNMWYDAKVGSKGGVEDTRLEVKAKNPKKSEAKDNLSEDRPSRGQGQEYSRPRPRTKAQVFSPQKRCSKYFSGNLKKSLQNFFFRRSKKFLQLKKQCCSRVKDRTIFDNLRLRDQGQRFDLRGQG